MHRMFIFTNFPEVHHFMGRYQVRFTNTEAEYQVALLDVDAAVSRQDFAGNIPVSNLVEMYVKRADKEGPGEGGNDWVFENAWAAPLTREQATRKYFSSLTRKGD